MQSRAAISERRDISKKRRSALKSGIILVATSSENVENALGRLTSRVEILRDFVSYLSMISFLSMSSFLWIIVIDTN